MPFDTLPAGAVVNETNERGPDFAVAPVLASEPSDEPEEEETEEAPDESEDVDLEEDESEELPDATEEAVADEPEEESIDDVLARLDGQAQDEAPKETRANRRVREALEQRNALAEQNRQLQATIERMAGLIEQQVSTQQWARQQAEQLEAQERERQSAAAVRQRIEALGFDPDAPGVQVWQGIMQQNEALAAKLAAFEQQQQQSLQTQQQQEVAAKVERYVAQMNGAVDSLLAKVKTDEGTKTAIKKAAYSLAAANRIARPEDAAKEAIKLFASALKRSGGGESKVSQEARTAAGMMSVRGATGGKKPGSHASGKQPKRDIFAIEKDLLGGRNFG